jgi:hypothetical protein
MNLILVLVSAIDRQIRVGGFFPLGFSHGKNPWVFPMGFIVVGFYGFYFFLLSMRLAPSNKFNFILGSFLSGKYYFTCSL